MDANKLEHKQLKEYHVFKYRGPFAGCMIPCGYQLIRVHTIFDVKVDGQQVVADRQQVQERRIKKVRAREKI